ncbi:Long-chain fatty acid transport protein [Litoreibacter ascidiaceicola]|uniref:Long-chain fatty acid transport protein n=1 Tax=Litoreibacter ascidiaceicola TaxID=1486859 RepID=A0A1M4VRZ7_9RHOB|nr:outer membrane protein transport protein [Litoreibacter ascidiaceicola]SHE71593.1 Long-chain fatty acid transport protein [Litoreibacter ascidiaceicola]
MKNFVSAAAILAASTSIVSAGGLDRSGQPIGIIFEQGNRVELSFGYTKPSVGGTDVLTNSISSVASNYLTAGVALKYDFNDKISFALIVDEPYGSDVTYPGSSATTMLGGTRAIVDSYAVTGIGRYKFNENFSVHGGIRYQEISAGVTLGGLAYAGLNGYNAEFASDGAFGFLVGGAYERPDIALRVALTYNSKITHNLATQETIGGAPVAAPGSTEVVAPESINLDFQTGIAKDTLLFGSIRYARHSQVIVSPAFFDTALGPTPGDSLTSLENSLDFTVGIGRRFNDQWSGFVSYTQNSKGDDDLVSPLAPTNGSKAITIGGKYTMDAVEISGGIRYTKLGDARPETGTPDVARANFTGNSAVSAGLKIAYKF